LPGIGTASGRGRIQTARAAITRLRGYGYAVVLDDFGTGWSSLDWVLELLIGGMRIDRGHHHRSQITAVKAFGFHYGQGYYWTPPVPDPCASAALSSIEAVTRPLALRSSGRHGLTRT
jgi:EAL domain-containing protein (putative c-di-GMP-specific phosphodiesterase class I)